MNVVNAKSAVALSVAAALMWPAVPANAGRIDGAVTVMSSVPSITVSYAELDISKPRGLEVLYSRIQRAAKMVCGFDYSIQELSRGRQANACYKSAVDNAVRQIDRPTLTALHRAKTRSALG
jgi:UrcA family protein